MTLHIPPQPRYYTIFEGHAGMTLPNERIIEAWPEHTCTCCSSQFHSDEGGLTEPLSDWKFCPECVVDNRHIEYVRDQLEPIEYPMSEVLKVVNEMRGC